MLGFHGISVAPISALSSSFSQIAGTTTITFSGTGVIRGSASIVGASTITFSGTGVLLTSLSASGTIVFSGTATLSSTITILPFTGQDRIGAHEYHPWHNPDGVTVYFNKGGHLRHRYFPEDIERQDVIVRKKLTISSPTAIQELDWDVYNFFDVSLNTDVEFTFSNPRDNSDFVILLTKDANASVRTVTFPASLAWPDNNSFTSLSVSGESKLLRVSYFGGRYRVTLY